jgi:flagellar hook-associated protein 2
MSDSNTIFTGSSQYATDFQQVIQRAVAIASLPLRQIQQQQSDLSNQNDAFSALSQKFDSLRASLDRLNPREGSFLQAALSDPGVSTVAVGSGALASSFTIDVLSPGSYSTSASRSDLPVVADPIAGSITNDATLTLSVDGVTFALAPSDGSLQALSQAINAANAGVHASLVNLGAPGAPDYKLVLRSSSLGPAALSLSDSSGDLLANLTTGTMAQYRVNGLPATPIQSNSRTVTVAPGITATLIKAGTTDVDLKAASSEWANSVSAFVAAFNATVDEIDIHQGKNGGALTGQGVPNTLGDALRRIVNYEGNGGIKQLSELGVSFDQQGKLEFDAGAFEALVASRPDDVAAFLNSEVDGGFLHAALQVTDAVNGQGTGTLAMAMEGLQGQMRMQDDRITQEQDRVSRLQRSLTEQMAAADAVVAMLEQQVALIKGMFQAMQANNGNN